MCNNYDNYLLFYYNIIMIINNKNYTFCMIVYYYNVYNIQL